MAGWGRAQPLTPPNAPLPPETPCPPSKCPFPKPTFPWPQRPSSASRAGTPEWPMTTLPRFGEEGVRGGEPGWIARVGICKAHSRLSRHFRQRDHQHPRHAARRWPRRGFPATLRDTTFSPGIMRVDQQPESSNNRRLISWYEAVKSTVAKRIRCPWMRTDSSTWMLIAGWSSSPSACSAQGSPRPSWERR